MKKRKEIAAIMGVFILSGMVVTPGGVKADTNLMEGVGGAAHAMSNPIKDSNENIVWDCVWFGSYPQAEIIPSNMEYTAVADSSLQEGDVIVSDIIYNRLQKAADWDENGDITLDGAKYRRILATDATYPPKNNSLHYQWSDTTTYHYFRYQAVKWRVLKINNNDAFLLSDIVLDDQKYNEEYVGITWENSTLRSWLNGYGASSNKYGKEFSTDNFSSTAFDAGEQSAVIETSVINENNLQMGTNGGNNTKDKVFLLSESEVYTDNATAFGFHSDYNTKDVARLSGSSTYAKAMGAVIYRKISSWSLRSVGCLQNRSLSVGIDGTVDARGGVRVDSIDGGIRPALHLNLASTDNYLYAGTVSSDGSVHVVNEELIVVPEDETTAAYVSENKTDNTAATTKPVQNGTVSDADNKNVKNENNDTGKSVNTVKVAKAKIKFLKNIKGKKLKITLKKIKGATGYQVRYSTSKKFLKKKTKTKSYKKIQFTLKKLKKGKKYYIRVRAYQKKNGTQIYGKWSKVKTKTIKK